MSISVTNSSGISDIGNSGEASLSTMFATLQLEMATEKKAQAEEVIAGIKAENEVIQQAREALAKARQAQGAGSEIPPGLSEWATSYNIPFDSSTTTERKEIEKPTYVPVLGPYGWTSQCTYSGLYKDVTTTTCSKEQWDVNIKNLESFIESRGMDTQTKMVQLEDLMGKYNSWSQGASKTISDGNQLMQSIMTR
jgi:hypothetical protein